MKLTIVALCVSLPSFLPAVFAGQKLGKQTLVDSSLPEPDAAARESRHFSLLAVEEIHPTNKDISYRAYLKIHEDKVGTWESDDAEFALYEGALVGKPEAASQGWKYACVRETGAKQGLLSLTRTGRSGREGVPGCTAWNEFNLETVDSVVEEENVQVTKLLYNESDTFYQCNGKIYFGELPTGMGRECIQIYIILAYNTEAIQY